MDADKQQLEKFKEAARELECDDDEEHFKDRLKRLIAPRKENGADE